MNSSPIRAFDTRTQLSIGAIAIAACTLAGPFGTIGSPWIDRTIFWGATIALNMAKWQLWFGLLARRVPALKRRFEVAAALGAVLLNLTLPFELNLVFELLDSPVRVPWLAVYLTAVLLSALIGLVIALLRPPSRSTAVSSAGGLAGRAGLTDLAAIMAVEAEDHYCRLHLADGRRPLILYRFRDALAELAGIDGAQVHRGAWVAATAVAGAEREGRKWRLRLSDGTAIPVSDGFAPAARARGWLRVAGRWRRR